MLPTPIRALVRTHFGLAEPLAPDAEDHALGLLVRAGRGLDPFHGERILHVSACPPDAHSAVITDVRIVLETPAQAIVELPLGSILDVVWSSDAPHQLRVVTEHGHVVLEPGESLHAWLGFFTALKTLPHTERVGPCVMAPWPSFSDPAGVESAADSLRGADPEARAVLRVVQAAIERGELDLRWGLELVERVLLAHRIGASGVAMREGKWLSAVSADDFAALLGLALGPGEKRQTDRPAVRCLEFTVDTAPDFAPDETATRRRTSPEALSLRARVPEPDVRSLRVIFADTPRSCSFHITAPVRPLHHQDPAFLRALLVALADLAPRMLLLRALYGPDEPAAQLLARDPDDVREAVARAGASPSEAPVREAS